LCVTTKRFKYYLSHEFKQLNYTKASCRLNAISSLLNLVYAASSAAVVLAAADLPKKITRSASKKSCKNFFTALQTNAASLHAELLVDDDELSSNDEFEDDENAVKKSLSGTRIKLSWSTIALKTRHDSILLIVSLLGINKFKHEYKYKAPTAIPDKWPKNEI
jgi:hypothetical protein